MRRQSTSDLYCAGSWFELCSCLSYKGAQYSKTELNRVAPSIGIADCIRQKMKTIGLIGGVSWFSTSEYYIRMNKLMYQRLGHQYSAKILLYSFNFEEILKYQLNNDSQAEANLLIEAAKKLEDAGADFILICSNTTNKTAQQIARAISIPIVDIIELTAQHICRTGLRDLGLLGTKSVMKQDFYRHVLASYGLRVTIPSDDECEIIHTIIYEELCHGIVKEDSKKAFLSIIDNLRSKGLEGIILGCTEIPILINQEDTPVRVFDSTQIHVERAVEMALSSI